MKNEFFTGWNHLLGTIATTALLLPVFLIVSKKLYDNKSFFALLLYYIFTFAHNLVRDEVVPVSTTFRQKIGLVNSYLDVPLILFFLMTFVDDVKLNKIIRYTIIGFLVYEALILAVMGVNFHSTAWVAGPELMVVLAFCIPLFLRQVKISISQRTETAKAFLVSSIAFGYCILTFLYILYYCLRTQYLADAYTLLYVSSFVSTVLMSIGLVLLKDRKDYKPAVR